MILSRFSASVALLVLASTALPAAEPFVFKDGDRVVLLGSTLIEREQKYGYWELALTLKNHDKNVTFRNLGWSGDTVHGEARGAFEFNSTKGFERMVDLTKELKPTVIVVCFGQNESFDGAAGVEKFTKGLEKLIDAVAVTKARIVLLSPTPFEKGPGLLDPKQRNADLAMYRDAIKSVAEKRKLEFVDLFERVRTYPFNPEIILTDNGLHFSWLGYLVTGPFLFTEQPERLGLWIDTVRMADQLVAIRQKIIAKNQLFFHRWRPQNQTYLFGFRKHEQGQNAKEIVEFDPLVAAVEAEIRELVKQVKSEK